MTRRALAAVATVVAALVIAAPARADWVWPVSGRVITTYRNGDDPYAAGQHRGIDIAAALGTTVVAAAGGEVRFAGTAGSSGVTVSIRTADGRFDTSYLHLASTAVRKSQIVAAGERVGTVGTTGVRSAEQPHLHFGVRDAGSKHSYHDPLAFLPPAPLAPEPPRPTPAPSPVPEPLTPEPGRAPAARPVPRRAPAARPTPHPAPEARPAPKPRAAPRRAPHRAPRGVALPRTAPHVSPRRLPLPRTAPGRAPNRPLSPSPLPAPASHAAPASGGAPTRSPARAPASSGPDLGYALACLGVLAAAALLGLSEDGRQATRRSRDRVAGALRPLTGRR
jgi:murein DD-endopeptidase MepM/ murein hydrolase activator NlpD